MSPSDREINWNLNSFYPESKMYIWFLLFKNLSSLKDYGVSNETTAISNYYCVWQDAYVYGIIYA